MPPKKDKTEKYMEVVYDKLLEIEQDLDNVNKIIKYGIIAFIFTLIGGIII